MYHKDFQNSKKLWRRVKCPWTVALRHQLSKNSQKCL